MTTGIGELIISSTPTAGLSNIGLVGASHFWFPNSPSWSPQVLNFYRIPNDPLGYPIGGIHWTWTFENTPPTGATAGAVAEAESNIANANLSYPAGGTTQAGRPAGLPSGYSDTLARPTLAPPYMYLGQNGWDGMDAPNISHGRVASVGGYGEKVITNLPSGRRVTIPFINPVRGDGSKLSRVAFDSIVYGGEPLTLTFQMKSGQRRHLIGCYPVSEVPVRNRHTSTWEHRITFQSQWGWFVGDPEYNPGAATQQRIEPLIHGIYFHRQAAGNQTITWGGATITFPAPQGRFVWTPSPPFQNFIATSSQYLQPYDTPYNGTTRAFYRNVVGGGTLSNTPRAAPPGATTPNSTRSLYYRLGTYRWNRGEVASKASLGRWPTAGGVPFRLRNYAGLY